MDPENGSWDFDPLILVIVCKCYVKINIVFHSIQGVPKKMGIAFDGL